MIRYSSYMFEADELADLLTCPVQSIREGRRDHWADRSEHWRIEGRDWWVLQQDLAAVRSAELEGCLARAAALASGPVLVVVTVPRLTASMGSRLRDFLMGPLADAGVAAVITSRRGGRLVHFPGGRRELVPDAHRGGRNAPRAQPARASRLSFTATEQWLLKVLLLRDAPRRWWGGPRGPITSIKQWADVAEVGYASAHRLWSALQARGWAGQSSEGDLVISGLGDLIEAWLVHTAGEITAPIPARPLYDLRDIAPGAHHDAMLTWLQKRSRSAFPWAVSGWMACTLLGVLQVTGSKPVTVTVADVEETGDVLEAWELQGCDQRDALCLIHIERSERPALVARVLEPVTGHQESSRSTVDGRTSQADLPHVDIWQATLDVCGDPARGREQADHIAHLLFGDRLV